MNFDRIGLVGPGAMGLFHAIYMAQAGLPVTLLDHRKSRARRLSGGVTLVRPAGADSEAVTVRAQIPCRPVFAERTPFDLLIFTVKAWATARAVEQAAHLIGPNTALLSLQNGLGNIEALRQHQKAELVLAGVTTSGATLEDEHTVIERGVGDIIIGSTVGNRALADEVAALLGRALPAEAVCDIWPVIWRKLAANCAINPLTAMLDIPNGLLPDTPARHLMGEVAFEVGQVAQALGVEIDVKELPRSVEDVCRLTAHNVSSMLQDTRAGKRTEVEQLNGAVAHAAEKVGIKAPLNMALTALLKAHEWRREYEQQKRQDRRQERYEHRRQRRAPSIEESNE